MWKHTEKFHKIWYRTPHSLLVVVFFLIYDFNKSLFRLVSYFFPKKKQRKQIHKNNNNNKSLLKIFNIFDDVRLFQRLYICHYCVAVDVAVRGLCRIFESVSKLYFRNWRLKYMKRIEPKTTSFSEKLRIMFAYFESKVKKIKQKTNNSRSRTVKKYWRKWQIKNLRNLWESKKYILYNDIYFCCICIIFYFKLKT